jgi:hypothetical protein
MNAPDSWAFPVSAFPYRKDAQGTAPDFTGGDEQKCSGPLRSKT